MTTAEINRLIIDASRELVAAIRTRPRNPERIDAARVELDELLSLRDTLNAGG